MVKSKLENDSLKRDIKDRDRKFEELRLENEEHKSLQETKGKYEGLKEEKAHYEKMLNDMTRERNDLTKKLEIVDQAIEDKRSDYLDTTSLRKDLELLMDAVRRGRVKDSKNVKFELNKPLAVALKMDDLVELLEKEEKEAGKRYDKNTQ